MLGLFTTTPVASLPDSFFGLSGGAGDDVITASNNNASATLYALTSEIAGDKGNSVASSGVRTLILDFRAPTSNTQSAQQSMTVVVTAS